MIKSVTVTNYLGDSITLELMRPDLSGFVIESITGLGPGKADINTTEIATGDGGRYNSARLSKRNIVIALKYYNWHETDSIETIRQLTYKYFPIKKPLTLVINADNRISKIVGYVESNEPDIFSNNSGASISIICPDPYFYSAGNNSLNTTIFAGVTPQFQFEFGNESLTEPLLLTGKIENKTETTIVYEGDSEIGIIIKIHAVGTVTGVTIHNVLTRESMTIDTTKLQTITGSVIVAADDIIISTLRGRKSVTLLRNGITTNILNCINRDADWFQLSKGENIFAYTAETGAADLQFVIENQVIYEGV